METDFLRLVGVALAFAGICCFWLAVNVFDGWVQRKVYPPIRLWWFRLIASAREKVRRRKPAGTAKHLSGPRRVGK